MRKAKTDEFYFLTPDGTTHYACDSVEGLAERACILLYRYAWVEMRAWQDRAAMLESEEDTTRRTRWSVAERLPDGSPKNIFIESFDGTVKVGDLTVIDREL